MFFKCVLSKIRSRFQQQPSENSVVALCKENWQNKLAERVSIRSGKGYKKEVIPVSPVKFVWQGNGGTPYTLQIAFDCAFTDAETKIVKKNKAEVYNLFRNKKYYWRVLDHKQNVITQSTFFTNDDPRWIRFPEPGKTPINFRDIGGCVTTGNKLVRQGMIYRGSDLEEWRKISKINWQYLVDRLRIKSEIDFRYPSMVKDKVHSRLGENVQYFFRPVDAYDSFTPEQNILFRDTVKLFAKRSIYPVYIHCSGGVDRTGEIAFLINALLGVPEEKLFEDYEISSLSLFPRHRDMDYFYKWRHKIASFAPDGSNIQKQTESYLLAIGVSQVEISEIRGILLEE